MIEKEELFKHGVNMMTYFQSRQYYQSCPDCSQRFIRGKAEPYLLQCGHVCCEQCFQLAKSCGCCMHDNVPKKLKIKGYTKLFQVEEQEEAIFYDFAITMGPTTCPLNHQSSTITFKELLTQFREFKEYRQALGGTAVLAIGPKTFKYQAIKEIMLIEMKALFNSKRAKINVLTRCLGGKDEPIR